MENQTNVDFFGDGVGEDYVAMNWTTAAFDDFSVVGSWNDTPLLGTPAISAFGPNSVGPYFGIIERASSVPEPSTLFLLGTGLVGLVGYVRRKKS